MEAAQLPETQQPGAKHSGTKFGLLHSSVPYAFVTQGMT